MFFKLDAAARRSRLFLVCGLMLLTTVLVSGQGRVSPPARITCDRNNLTVYEGKVISYTRRADRIIVKIHTDSDTDETVTLRYARGTSPARWFLLNGEAFERGDWSKIESSKGKLYPNMRVNAWVCTDGRKPVLDWRPS
ncbi:MAG: hypothetical protein JOZ52_10515 [Acidobacteria bacterium]|nr:hypothetical protein [Acidobacteriota bacterium]